MNIGFIFTTAPFGKASGREGLDAVLAVSNYSDDLALFFIGDGVLQLAANQDSTAILSRNHIKTFKMLPMCEVEKIYLCQDSLIERGLEKTQFVLDVERLSASQIASKLAMCKKVLRF